MTCRFRRGLGLVEVLVVIGTVALLVGLTLPAVQAARESARRLGCAANLRQLGMAIHLYERTWNVFPPLRNSSPLPCPTGWYCSRAFSAHVRLLPYMEQRELVNAINFFASGLIYEQVVSANRTIVTAPVAGLSCPTEPRRVSGGTNYRVSLGPSGAERPLYRGAFTGPGTRHASFRDGLSTTIAMSEKPLGSGNRRRINRFSDWVFVGRSPSTEGAENWRELCQSLVVDEASDDGAFRVDAGHAWLLAGAMYTAFFTSTPPNANVIDCGTMSHGGTGAFTARSHHPGGVNVLMGDASAHWFSSGTSPNVWAALGTRAGGEAVGLE